MKQTLPKPAILVLALFIACSSDAGSKPSTKHSGEHMNRLSQESSPYLLQHANNPVDWYPWGEEAFQEARKRDKPIFLSIGYSTCHWCHVMEHESFEDEEVAQLMNDNFVSIKVDREELPEIDHVYMSVCQAMTGRGHHAPVGEQERQVGQHGEQAHLPPGGVQRSEQACAEKTRSWTHRPCGTFEARTLKASVAVRSQP